MKTLMLFALIVTQSVWATDYVCKSQLYKNNYSVKTNGSAGQIKISDSEGNLIQSIGSLEVSAQSFDSMPSQKVLTFTETIMGMKIGRMKILGDGKITMSILKTSDRIEMGNELQDDSITCSVAEVASSTSAPLQTCRLSRGQTITYGQGKVSYSGIDFTSTINEIRSLKDIDNASDLLIMLSQSNDVDVKLTASEYKKVADGKLMYFDNMSLGTAAIGILTDKKGAVVYRFYADGNDNFYKCL